MTLGGKRIVILGGSSGIGLAVAQAASREGAAAVIVSSRQARIDAALATLPAGTEGRAADLADEAAVRALFQDLGAYDHMVFTAGDALRLGPLAATDLAAARQVFELRYWGAFLAAKHGAGGIRAGGSIVFTSGTAGRRSQAGWTLAASVCAAMEGLTRALAVELAPIRVNIVSPGVVATPLWGAMPPPARDALFEQLGQKLPLGHVGSAEEVAETYLYLIRQTYGTGQVVVVDGGGTLV
ncbi:SDR family oxidoreductase [Rhodopila globiformis]|uniref:Short-chain dehydrogenase n=1 Tax=Rhodopila globiformis TaxID=1071 RepID=A0A2S6MWG1_RHOGL|nr:SDR family oxidoreductase [Rhodopila globiformis]PPQ26699.1 short-chain dehydrogenase [Rhodopila globiformis]